MGTAVLLGVDIGSSGAKATAMTSEGLILAQGRADYRTHYPRAGWAEQDPEDWFEGACSAIRSCLDAGSFSTGDVSGIAFVGPAHNAALLDGNDRSLRPCIHWSDLRSIRESRSLQEASGERIFQVSGQPVNPSWTLSQLAWIRAHEPEVWSGLRKVLVTKDYVRYRFTGEYVTDPYDAVGTQLFDLSRSSWSDELCSLIGLDPHLLPRVLPSHAGAGRMRADVAKRLGLPGGTFVAVGGGDSAVEAFGVGALNPGDGIVKIGTSGCFNIVTSRPTPSSRTLTYPYLFDRLGFTIAVTSNGTAALQWLRSKLLGGGEMTFEDVVGLASSAPPGSNGLIFHPYLMGERTPYWDPRLRGAFIGLSARHGPADFARAVLEGVAFTLRDCMETVKEIGLQPKSLFLLGGGSRSPLWASIVASVLGSRLVKPPADDAAVGAAKLAGLGAGVFSDWRSAGMLGTGDQTTISPDPGDSALYNRYFAVFRETVVALAPSYHALHDLSQEKETPCESSNPSHSAGHR